MSFQGNDRVAEEGIEDGMRWEGGWETTRLAGERGGLNGLIGAKTQAKFTRS